MCAICGIINKDGSRPDLAVMQAMTRTMTHRGPDDEGYEILGNAAFGFKRLSIIDLSHGHQPMSNEDDSLWIVFNGEIYNFQELRNNLDATKRHRFKTNCDTEIILHLYEEHGERCVELLRGMFAFAIWDKKRNLLFAARDRFGKKPFVYAETPSAFLFSSELRALLKHPSVTKEIDYVAIDQYLAYQYIPSPRTIFKGIKKLPPAHTLIFRDGKVTINCYWRPPFQPKTKLSFSEARVQFLEKLKEATRLRLISEVPLGAFLSGGKDSSLIVGLMSQLSSQPVKTFSIGFEEESFSEVKYAREVAKRFGCDHHEFVVKYDMVDVLPKLAWHYGEPYADSSALPTYYLSKMTRQYVTVALNGDGGDETMAGYPRYPAMRLMKRLKRIPLPLRKAIFSAAGALPDGTPPRSLRWRIKRLLGLGLADERRTYIDALCFFNESQKEPLYTDFMKEQVKGTYAPDYINGILSEAKDLDDIDPYLYTDLITYLPECLMAKVDIASMANSLEARSPFLDHEFVELVGSFPPSWKLRGLFQSKYIMNEAMKDWMPETVLTRKKQGFSIPMSEWFKGPLRKYVAEMLLSDRSVARGLFRKEAVERLITEHQDGRVEHSYELWALLMLEQWYQTYMD